MIALFKRLTISQTHAALTTLEHCISKSNDTHWHLKIGTYELGRVAFHALFFADFYLNQDETSFKAQRFHLNHMDTFENYAELKDIAPGPAPDRDVTMEYLQHCRQKAKEEINKQSETDLAAEHTAPWFSLSKAEVFTYNVRHIQHHAAQISLRLRVDASIDIPWVRCGSSQ